MAKVVYTEWFNDELMEDAEVIGVYENDSDGYKARENKETELKEDGYDTEDDVRVWIEDIEIVRDEVITNNEIELVMNALAGHPIMTSSKFADKVERILKKFVQA